MIRKGKSVMDARCGGTSCCVETNAFGKENYNLTGYFNMPKVLEITLNNGAAPRTAREIGLETGDLTEFETFENFFEAYEKQLNHFVNIKMRGHQVIERLYAKYIPAPFLSLLIDDCIATEGMDGESALIHYNNGDSGNVSTKVTEPRSSIMTKRLELTQDSGGPGKWRGGLGTVRDLVGKAPHNACITWHRYRSRPWELEGDKSPMVKKRT